MRGLLAVMLLVAGCAEDSDRSIYPLWKYTCHVEGWCDSKPYSGTAEVCATSPADGAEMVMDHISDLAEAVGCLSYTVEVDCVIRPITERWCLDLY